MNEAGNAGQGLRVSFILPNLMVGGAERQALKLIAALPPGAVDLTLVVLQGWYPQPLRDEVPPNVRLLIAPFGRRDPRVISWLARHMRDNRSEVVQAFLWYSELIAALACRLSPGVILIGSERGDRSPTFYSLKRRVLDRTVIFPAVARFVANSEASEKLLQHAGVQRTRIERIPNGVKLDPPTAPALPNSGTGSSTFVACSVGSLQRYKGVDTLVRAAAACSPESCVRAVIVGDGPERPALEALARELGVESRVEFVGRQLGPEVIMRQANVGVLASNRDEACSNSILEFMACGRPVFASNVGGNPELVIDGVTGRLFSPGNWRELAGFLEDGARNPAQVADLGCHAFSRVKAFHSIETAAAAYAELWSRSALSRSAASLARAGVRAT